MEFSRVLFRSALIGSGLNDEGAVRIFGDLEQRLSPKQPDKATFGNIADADCAVGVEGDGRAVREANRAALSLGGGELARVGPLGRSDGSRHGFAGELGRVGLGPERYQAGAERDGGEQRRSEG